MTKLIKGFLYKIHKNCKIFEKKILSNIRQRNLLQSTQEKKTNPTPKPITVLEINQTIILKNEPSIRESS